MVKPSKIVWMPVARESFNHLKEDALRVRKSRKKSGKTKSSKQEGLFKQVLKTIDFLKSDPRHPGLNSHQYSDAADHPYDITKKVFGAYAQNNTPGAYRIFWCYGPNDGEITIIAIAPHK